MIVDSLLVIPVAALYLAVVPGRCRADRFVFDMKSTAKYIQWVDALCLCRMCKFPTVVCLDHIRGITEIDNIRHIQRGYEDIVGKLKAVGADIELVTVPDDEDALDAG